MQGSFRGERPASYRNRVIYDNGGFFWHCGIALPEQVAFWKDDGEIGELVSSPHLARVTALSLMHIPVQVEDLYALAESPHLRNLTELRFWSNQIDADRVAVLADGPQLALLTDLVIAGNAIGDERVAALAESPFLTRLRKNEPDPVSLRSPKD
jgi:hypothetical protein